VLFSNGSTIAQDNSNFFWDATNHRLGIGTTTPGALLQLGANGAPVNNNGLLVNASPNGGGTLFGAYTNYMDRGGGILMSIANQSGSALVIDNARNVSIGDTTATSMFNVGTANQFQVTSTGVSSAGAGSTDYSTASSAQVAHCLADGTGCPSLNNTIQGGIILTTATSDSTTLTYSSAYNAASCVFSPTDSTATLLTILPYLTSLATTGSVSVTINHAATVGNGATYNIVCSIWHST
jgi:hypothetical protein